MKPSHLVSAINLDVTTPGAMPPCPGGSLIITAAAATAVVALHLSELLTGHRAWDWEGEQLRLR
jgi:hypothetical protein